MCIMCDGASLDEARFSLHHSIETYGWAIQYVESDRIARTWAYTVGLSAGFDHPELAIVGVSQEIAAGTLNSLGELVRSGDRLEAGQALHDDRDEHWLVRAVHPAHFGRGVFAVWEDYYESLGGSMPRRVVLEIVPPGRRSRLESPASKFGSPPDHRAPRPRPGDGRKRRRGRDAAARYRPNAS